MKASRIAVWLYRASLEAISFVVVYAIYLVLDEVETNRASRFFLLLVSCLALSLAVAALWHRNRVAIYAQIFAISALGLLYLFEFTRAGNPDVWEVAKQQQAEGPIAVDYSPARFAKDPQGGITLPRGQRIFPLSGVANRRTVMCQDGKLPVVEYVADEYGFNNPKGVWGKPVDIVLIGDSLTYGVCLPSKDHFVTQIRAFDHATLNLAQSGIGPLIELATVREYVSKIHPKYIFYIYNEANDLYVPAEDNDPDVAVEYENDILRRYLEDESFSEQLFEQHVEVDTQLKLHHDQDLKTNLRRYSDWAQFLRFLSLPRLRDSLRKVNIDIISRAKADEIGFSTAALSPRAAKDFEIFKKALTNMEGIAGNAGARFVFVNVPSAETLCVGKSEHPLRMAALKFALNSRADFINLENDLGNAVEKYTESKVFSGENCAGNFTALAHQVIGTALVQYLKARQSIETAPSSADISKSLPSGWLFGTATPSPESSKGPQAPPQDIIVKSITSAYDNYVNFNAVIDGASPARNEGASILGSGYRLQEDTNLIRIYVRFPAYSLIDNNLVATVFIGYEDKPRETKVEHVKAGSTSTVEFSFVMERPVRPVLGIDVRVGSSAPGALYLNGDNKGPQKSFARPILRIEEIHRGDATSLVFRPIRPGQLVYSGAL